MNTAETLYVFHGYGGENSLHPLARYFEAHQLNTYMIDNQVYPCPKEEVFNILAQKRAGRRVVYFTSAISGLTSIILRRSILLILTSSALWK